MKQTVVYSQISDTEKAFKEVSQQLLSSGHSYSLLIFFASSIHDFDYLSAQFNRVFPNIDVVGVSSGGEISAQGFCQRGLLVTTLSDESTTIKSVLIPELSTFPILHKSKITNAFEQCNIDINEKGFEKHSFALTFINGLRNLEEYFLSLFYAVIKNREFQLVGASAGDDYRFYQTKISLNGVTSLDGAVIILFNTTKKFHIYKQNIYSPTGNVLHINKTDIENRVILSINDKMPLTAYAEELGLTSTTLIDTMLEHPLGRTYGNETYITSLAGFNPDKTLNMRTRIFPETTLDILKLDDIQAISKTTCDKIVSDTPKIGFIFFVVCICNVINYNKNNTCDQLTTLYNSYFDTYCGFASCGEQMNQYHMSQTTIALVMEE